MTRLGWGDNTMRWITAMAFINAFQKLDAAAESAQYPFCILHDPGDSICLYKGSVNFLKKATGSNARIVEMNDALHEVWVFF